LGFDLTDEELAILKAKDPVDPIGTIPIEGMEEEFTPAEVRSVRTVMRMQDEMDRVERWAANRNNPDPADFKSDILTPEGIATIVSAVANSQDAPFHGWDDYP
jgi:hypothetical protein